MIVSKFEQNLSGVIVEMALKLGLNHAPLSLNYPCASLGRMLGVEADPQALKPALEAFFAARAGLYGAVHVEPHEDGFCLAIPAEGVEVPDAETIELPEDAAQESTPDTDPADERRDDTNG